MTDVVDATIAELRALHDRLTEVVGRLPDEALTGPSGAAEWTVADVLSHLGSGAEITRYTLQRAAGGEAEAPANQEVWDRWNALSPVDQAAGSVASNEALVAFCEELTAEQRSGLQVDLGFLPQPVPLATALGMRLQEAALHTWDVEVGLDPSARLSEESARLLAEHLSTTMAFLLGFAGRPGELEGSTRLGLDGYTVVVSGEEVRLEEGEADTSATFEGPLEAGVRLLTGRLGPAYTPDGVAVRGDVTLDQLRRVFPGY